MRTGGGGGLSSVFVVTAVQINSEEEDPLWVCQSPYWLLSTPAIRFPSEQ